MNGISDPAEVRAGAQDQVLERLIPHIADRALQLARATMDRLAVDSASTPRPVMLHSDLSDIQRIVGQTLFWAHHYLMVDQIASARWCPDPAFASCARTLVGRLGCRRDVLDQL
jgi:hypothetical protein